MSVSLPILNQNNIAELEMLKSVLGVKFNSKTQMFELDGGFSINQLMTVYFELKNTIWSRKNIDEIVMELEVNNPEHTRIHYFGNGRPVGLDSYLSKMGLLEHEVLVEDPLCFPISVNPTYQDHITRNPSLYVKHVFENSLAMIYLEEWIRKGYVYFIPNLPLINIEDFWGLAKINEKLASSTNFENTNGIKKSMRYSMVEGKINFMLESSRLTQIHYTEAHMKKIFPGISDEEAKKRLDLHKTQTLEQREQSLVEWALKDSKLTQEEEISLLSYFERTRPFNIERYLDISSLDGGLIANTGMPLLHATYLSERFHCIPSTDNLGLMYGYEGWCEALQEEFDSSFEKVNAKVELPFTFLDKMPLEFIEHAREQGKGHKATTYLDQEWNKVRTASDISSYRRAVHEFSTNVKNDFMALESDHSQMIDELIKDGCRSGYLGLGAFVAFNLTTQMPIAIIGGMSAMLASVYDASKSYSRSKNELNSKPLAVFFEAKKVVKKS